MAHGNDMSGWSVADYREAYSSGQVSVREAATAAFERISKANPTLNAVVEVLEGDALAAADAADKALRSGHSLGPLHGVPVTIKMNVDYEGLATTEGVPAFADRVAKSDAPVVRKLREAGAIIVGRTNAAAMTFGLFTDNPQYGPTLNPWDHAITPGGSSGGAAVSVAAGMVPIAHCNDSGGSIRYPAYCCGVMGLRPTVGRVPHYNGTSPSEPSIVSQLVNTNGPIAGTIADLRVGLNAMSGLDASDPWSLPCPQVQVRDPSPCKVAMVASLDNVTCDPSTVETVHTAARWLEEAGYIIEEIEPPHFREASELRDRLLIHEIKRDAMDGIVKFGTSDQVNEARALVGAVPEVSFEEFCEGLARRNAIIRAWSQFMETYPIVLTPTSWRPPMKVGTYANPVAMTLDQVMEFSPLHISPLLGVPALSLPTGLVDGVPTGVHLMAGRFQEDVLLAAGSVIERSCGRLVPSSAF